MTLSKVARVINYANRVMLQIVASITVVFYDRNMFIVQQLINIIFGLKKITFHLIKFNESGHGQASAERTKPGLSFQLCKWL
jgi:hypothetical protein